MLDEKISVSLLAGLALILWGVFLAGSQNTGEKEKKDLGTPLDVSN